MLSMLIVQLGTSVDDETCRTTLEVDRVLDILRSLHPPETKEFQELELSEAPDISSASSAGRGTFRSLFSSGIGEKRAANAMFGVTEYGRGGMSRGSSWSTSCDDRAQRLRRFEILR
ncbi:hypothetical protein HC256_002992 [Beauveria bassiana]|nr:hypothetical protein HC256_002992 [Beauveria bassiana]